MPTTRYIFLAFVLLLSASSAFASKEGILPLDTFQLSSSGIGESGPVRVSGNRGTTGFSSFSVSAFGREIRLSKDQLAKLSPALINGATLSYEQGHKELGGRTVYITLTKGYTSGTQEKQVISVNEDGFVNIRNDHKKQ